MRQACDFYKASLAAVDPLTNEQAMASAEAAHWNQAMDNEMSSLHENDTYLLEPLPFGCKAILSAGSSTLMVPSGTKLGWFRPFLKEQVPARKVRRIVTNGERSLEKCTLDRRS